MDIRGRLLNHLDRETSDGNLADRDCVALITLAEAIARSLAEWRLLIVGLELQAPCDLRQAGALVLESVFDEILSGPQWRVLAAAFALTELAG